MTDRGLRIQVIRPEAMETWQSACVDALALVEGVHLSDWSSADQPADVILDLADDPTAPAPVTPTEVWRFRFGSGSSPDRSRVLLRDYARGPGTTRVTLTSDTPARTLREGWLQTPSWFHPADVQRALLAPSGWPAAVAQERIHATSASPAIEDRGDVTETPDRERKRAEMPMSALRAAAVGRRLMGKATHLVRHDDWNVGIIDLPIASMLSADTLPAVTWLPVRAGHYAADPFGIERDGTLHLLYEDLDQRTALGSIHHVAVDLATGRTSSPELVLDPGCHASYPYLIEHDGRTFMLPEISASGDLVLYEATDFPLGWQPVATLLPGIPAVDASITQFDGQWWLFACRADRGVNSDLSIWHAPDLFGPWTAHTANPVKSDARSSRPGGTPFVVDGVLYRPGQDDSRIYGGRLVINRIEILTPESFLERPIKAVEPLSGSAYPDGLHTLSSVSDRVLIDGNRRRFLREVFQTRLPGRLGG